MVSALSAAADRACAHCGQPVPPASPGGAEFCCAGCAGAHAIISDLGLDQYYARRSLDPDLRALKPDEDGPARDFGAHVAVGRDGLAALHLMVDGLHCAACVWLIEAVLSRVPGVRWARVNMSTRRLVVKWRPGEADANALVDRVTALGYRLLPFDPAQLDQAALREEKALLRSLAVAGFAAGNIMLLSISVWAGYAQDMGAATRDLLHWISALIAIPAVGYAGRPFFASAWTAVSARRMNMDVPISLAVLLALGMSLFETANGGVHVYFDSAVTLLFFLLIGRYLDRRARRRARGAAEHLLALQASAVTVIGADGVRGLRPPAGVRPGECVLVAAGERVGVDGRVSDGVSEVETGLIDGESVPRRVAPGDPVFAGMVNLGAPIRVAVTAAGEDTLLAEIVRLMEAAERGRAEYVALADRVARLYAPAVHGLALATFLAWIALMGVSWQQALLYAIAVLIVTCPCALAIAVPAVQVIASGRLFARGVLLKSATALERLAGIDTVVFDKTGTLTKGRAELADAAEIDAEDLAHAASMAATSSHPLARALVRAAPLVPVAQGVREVPGCGLAQTTAAGEVRLGRRAWCGIDALDEGVGPELWLSRPDRAPVRFAFEDALRPDAQQVVRRLRQAGYQIRLLSGDRAPVVAAAADALGIDDFRSDCRPEDKMRFLEDLVSAGRRVLMVGDGLNDAPALAAATVSVSPASAADVSQIAADAVFQGDRLAPLCELLATARRAERIVRQNLALAFGYNALTIPLAVAGLVTPLLAAVAMSASSLLVVVNAVRAGRAGER
ncbi:MAG: heavy metal translocating P-type ATPase metal-binding domain-containing protein [Alphaproteobacteria bacterium]|nr:heavy metal translocating P-type ATPase metal-binding domain-containing protein [Alphaproteobacteria bacterium]